MRENEIDMEKICDILKEDYKIPAYVEQTGGGTATIYAGELKPVTRESVAWYPASGAEGPDQEVVDGKIRVDHGTVTEEKYAAVAGPGWFRGPGWQHGVGELNDFYIGPDDDSTENFMTSPGLTEHDVARIIAGIVNDDIVEHATQWGTLSFFPDPNRGAYYTAAGNRVGELFAPMHTDGSMDPEEITEISHTYEDEILERTGLFEYKTEEA